MSKDQLPIILLKKVSLKDIQFDQRDLDNMETYSIGYNLGDLIEMPALYLSPTGVRYWKQKFHQEQEGLTTEEIRKLMISVYPLSILKFYFVAPLENREKLPNKNRLLQAINDYWDIKTTYQSTLSHRFQELQQFIQSNDVLCVHLRCGDTTLETSYDRDYTEFIKRLAGNFRYLIVFTGLIPGYAKTMGLENVRSAAHQHINTFLSEIPNCYFILEGSVDDHICIFRKAHHLALHRGGISQILSIINPHNLYLNSNSGWWVDKMTNRWKELVTGKLITNFD